MSGIGCKVLGEKAGMCKVKTENSDEYKEYKDEYETVSFVGIV